MKNTWSRFTFHFLAILSTFILLAKFTPNAFASDSTHVLSKYIRFSVPPTFAYEFRESEDKKNFKKLRSYYAEQKDIISKVNNALVSYSSYGDFDTTEVGMAIMDLNAWAGEKNLEKSRKFSKMKYYRYLYQYSFYIGYDWQEQKDGNDTITHEDITKLASIAIRYRNHLGTKRMEFNNLTSNLAVLEQDLKTCERTIDEALRPETEDQNFRSNMSWLFAGLIAVLLIIFFLLIFKRGDHNIARELLSALGLQFITLFVLIIAIILFGILDILKGSELAAILAGISGYILGSKTAATPQPPATPPADGQ